MKGIVGQLALVVQQTGTSTPSVRSGTKAPATATFKTWTAAHRRQGAAVSYAKPR